MKCDSFTTLVKHSNVKLNANYERIELQTTSFISRLYCFRYKCHTCIMGKVSIFRVVVYVSFTNANLAFTPIVALRCLLLMGKMIHGKHCGIYCFIRCDWTLDAIFFFFHFFFISFVFFSWLFPPLFCVPRGALSPPQVSERLLILEWEHDKGKINVKKKKT